VNEKIKRKEKGMKSKKEERERERSTRRDSYISFSELAPICLFLMRVCMLAGPQNKTNLLPHT
jgi:hypothetical protein